jgi:putative DNA primase/helicase
MNEYIDKPMGTGTLTASPDESGLEEMLDELEMSAFTGGTDGSDPMETLGEPNLSGFTTEPDDEDEEGEGVEERAARGNTLDFDEDGEGPSGSVHVYTSTQDTLSVVPKQTVAKEFAAELVDEVSHHDTRGWFHFNGRVWTSGKDAEKAVYRAVLGRLEQRVQRAKEEDNGEAQEFYEKLIDDLPGIAKRMSYTQTISLSGEPFDTDPYALNCQNGIIDLHDGTLYPHDSSKLMTQLCPTSYDPQAQCPNFLEALNTIFAGRQDLITYVQQVLGYSITGDVGQHKFWVWYGPSSRNGKSLLANIVRGLTGSGYSRELDPRSLEGRNRNNHIPSDIARLCGARVVTSREPAADAVLCAALLKNFTGGDTMVARLLYQNEFEFAPVAKLHLISNYHPHIDETGEALRQRIRVIPFDVHIPDVRAAIPNFAATLLKTEGSGILAWLVNGAVQFASQGSFTEPECVTQATAAYWEAETAHAGNMVDTSAGRDFIEERLETAAEASLAKDDVYDAYRQYANEAGCLPVSAKAFGQVMSRHGFERLDVRNHRITADDGSTRRAWYNIAFKSEENSAS